jgi:hypothetical protein
MLQVHINRNLGTEIDPKLLCHQPPVSTFDGTLIDDMGFGTLTTQVVSGSNFPAPSSDNATVLGRSRSMVKKPFGDFCGSDITRNNSSQYQ